MKKPLNILIIEDNFDDAYLIEKNLQRSGLQFNAHVVTGKEDFMLELNGQPYDVILTDNGMPQFDSMDVLNFLNEKKLKTPVIIVSGTINQQNASSMIKKGVFDYVGKDNLKILAGVITKAIG